MTYCHICGRPILYGLGLYVDAKHFHYRCRKRYLTLSRLDQWYLTEYPRGDD